MKRWLVLSYLWLVTMLAAVVPAPLAFADEAPVVTVPADAPLVLQPSKVELPPIPSEGYEQQDLGWLRIAYPASVRERIDPLVRGAEDFKAKLTRELGQPVLERVEVRVGRSPEDMASLAPRELPPPAYATGVAYPSLDLVVLSLQVPGTYEAPDLDEVFRHELTHVALEDAVAGHHVPRWFNEGLAVYESGEGQYARTRALWDAHLSKTVLPLAELDRRFPAQPYEVNIAYAESADFVRFLLRSADRARFAALVERVRGGQAFERALADAYGTDLRRLEYQWREDLGRRFSIWPVLAGGSFIWVLFVGLLVVGYWRRRKQAKEKLALWEREEAAADAARARALREAAHDVDTEPEIRGPIVRAVVPKIEHDGRWHTLH